MKKYYLVFLCATTLTAQHDFMAPELLDTEATVQHLQIQAYSIRDALQAHEKVAKLFGAEVATLINKLTSTKIEQAHIPAFQQAVRRYQALAEACIKAHEAPEELDYLLTLLAERKELVQKIEIVSRPCVYANLILYNLAHHLGREPSPTEVQSFTAERDSLLKARNQMLGILNEKLFLIEKEILKDHRTWLEKYGPTLKGSLIVLGVLVLVGRMIDLTHAKFIKK